MTWFRIDDQFYDHPKVVALFDGAEPEAAIALWVLAGAWCARHLTDGLVPRGQVRRLGVANGPAAAAELVRVGLWANADEGYLFNDWTDWNPSRDEVETKRAQNREKVRRHRERKARDAASRNPVTDGGRKPVTGTAGNPVTPPPVTTHPPRPDPGLPKKPASRARAERLARSLALLVDGWGQRYRDRVGVRPPASHRDQFVRSELPEWVLDHIDEHGGSEEELVELLLDGFWSRDDLRRPPAKWLAEDPARYLDASADAQVRAERAAADLAELRAEREREQALEREAKDAGPTAEILELMGRQPRKACR